MTEKQFKTRYDGIMAKVGEITAHAEKEKETCGGLFRERTGDLSKPHNRYLLAANHPLMMQTAAWYRKKNNIPVSNHPLSDGERFEVEAYCLDCLIRRNGISARLHPLRDRTFKSLQERADYFEQVANDYAAAVKEDFMQNRAKALTLAETEELDKGFDLWWEIYPVKVGKGKAREKWRKLRPTQERVEYMIAAVKEQKKSQRWADGYIPNPTTWLNQGRWDDELPPAVERERSYDIAELEALSYFDVPDEL